MGPPVEAGVVNHWEWRPEWAADRPCWYWYLTFLPGEVERVVDQSVLDKTRATAWLDPVPSRWLHLTVCDVGFDDELTQPMVEAVHRSVSEAAAEGPPALRVGPVEAMRSAVVLRADGGRALSRLHKLVSDATAATLGPAASLVHRHRFIPHVTLGYVNRPVDKAEVDGLLGDMVPVSSRVRPARLALVAVTRRGGHYQWTPWAPTSHYRAQRV